MEKMKVAAFMTAPRYENVWARNIIEAALKKAGIPLVCSGGVFYGQCMQIMFEDAIKAGVELGITVDFDSIFTHQDVNQLIGRICSNDYIDALASLQSRRGMPFPLFTDGDKDRVEFDGSPLRVRTAHFGLTAIKFAALKDLPKPWFWSKPDEDGCWRKNKIDDDIYFWDQWHKNGRSVFIDSSVSIGHLEEVIASFDDNGNHRFVYPNDWYEKHFKC